MNNITKICGITNLPDAVTCARLGASHLGLIFHPESKRYINIKSAEDIIINIKLKYPNIKITGVFVNHNHTQIQKHLDKLDLDFIQLHGEISKQAALSNKKLFNIPKIYVININPNDKKTNNDLNLNYIKNLNPKYDFILFDLPKNNKKIKHIPLNLISNIIQKHSILKNFKTLLAGNISEKYLSDIINTDDINKINQDLKFKIGFDICSSVEKKSNSQEKDKTKLIKIFKMINKLNNKLDKLDKLCEPQNGYFGKYGGQFVPEILIPALTELETQADKLLKNPEFIKKLDNILHQYAGRPTPLTPAENLANYLYPKTKNKPKIYLKREDLLHTGAHKLNNALGQCLLAKYMNKNRIIAETGAGQHGVATATACAYLNLECIVYMGEADCKRQKQNVSRMKALGAKVHSVKSGQATLKEAVNEAMRDYATNFASTNYCLGSALGPHPYPKLVAHFQKIIGLEIQDDCKKLNIKPDYLIAPVGGGSNAIGMFLPFLKDTSIKMIGVEAGGSATKPKEQPGKHASRFNGGSPGILHGSLSYLLQNQDGQILPTESISAGLDYPSVGPQHAHLHHEKRVKYTHISDKSALNGFHTLTKTEGIIPALESSHAIAYLIDNKRKFKNNEIIIINLSGRGDKDLDQIFKNN